MAFSIFEKLTNKIIGVDIGTFSIKMAQVSKFGSQINLDNYSMIRSYDFLSNPFRNFDEKKAVNISVDDTVNAIKAMVKEAKFDGKESIFSVPDFSTFFTWFSLPPLKKEEVQTAVEFEARKYIPISLDKVTLDWDIIESKVVDNGEVEVKILLAAISNDIIKQYQEIAGLCGLKLIALESEVFALARIFNIYNKEREGILVDFGATTTTISIVNNGHVSRSYDLDLSGNDITKKIMDKFHIENPLKAEELKYKIGIKSERKESAINSFVSEIMPFAESLADNIKGFSEEFAFNEGKDMKKIFLSGGSSMLPGLKEFLFQKLGKEVIIMNGFDALRYIDVLHSKIENKGPIYNVALGVSAYEL